VSLFSLLIIVSLSQLVLAFCIFRLGFFFSVICVLFWLDYFAALSFYLSLITLILLWSVFSLALLALYLALFRFVSMHFGCQPAGLSSSAKSSQCVVGPPPINDFEIVTDMVGPCLRWQRV
ncbi:hypothetical protein TorRG33x02_032610, partial [Trema orientale]